ncbi:2-succinyl-6-hydroxy-2,4-cyclohexadiene-1-carboxylate synthase [Alkalinema sp. FACHB-956]|uniref:2-succinyl-6-hydroxy-2, 4-cyclohexadiene-1-carboxylate synthase n=1 Tax=Alkalinema sp. FACHB-956 TaxID=2692768 RepID=UPI0016882DFB|nr:2-succinyl-6-hydroxy-2,4-cyclohexadiene-1-carboxylate synthase [Alkalinema sp. FACHB-956]MBD2329504.1 2-succinyl-6-hydroxy-2,4-cyclohexadiene-1-carboxylate synthase [Alkalinema sp. FACHB-956]
MLHYQTDGSPEFPALCFLHGFLGRGDDFSELVNYLSQQFYCICIDLPGHGYSLDLPSDTYAMAYAAFQVVAVLNDLAISQASLYGYSMGGRLALYLALYYPDRFPQVFLESASPGLASEAERNERYVRDMALAAELQQDFPRFLDCWYQQPLFQSLRQHPKFPAIYQKRQQNHPQDLTQSLRAMGLGVQPNLWPHLPHLTQPIQLIAGEWDRKFVAIQQTMAQSLPNAKCTIVPQAGHNVHLEQPAAIQAIIHAALDRSSSISQG